MLNLKKTAVAVLAFGSSAVFAGTMGPVCSAVNVTVPCESTAWDLGAKALYLQPSIGGTNAGYEKTVTTGAGETANFGRNPQWGWGFMIEGSYHFNTGNDLNLNWYHINNSHSRSFAGTGTLRVNPFADGPVFPTTTTATVATGSASIDPHWDAVNLEFGQHVDFGENKSIRFHGGFEYARLTANNTFNAAGSIGTVPYSLRVTNNPTYNGFGPRLGADMGYDWGNGLGLYANGAAGLLAGSSKFSTTHTDVLTTRAITTSGSSTIVVPELEAKLGATYSYAMAQGDLTLDIGWMWVNYFNAIRTQGDRASDNVTTGDFGLQGPFVGLKWLGNVA